MRSLYACGPAAAILSGQKNMTTSHRVKGRIRGENNMSAMASGCRGRSSNVSRVLWSQLQLSTQMFFVTQHSSPVKLRLKPHHIGILLCLCSSPPPPPSVPPRPHTPPPSQLPPPDIDLGRVATAPLQLNMPEALRKARMRCWIMDHIDLLCTVRIHASAAAPTLSGHLCHSRPPCFKMLDTQPVIT